MAVGEEMKKGECSTFLHSGTAARTLATDGLQPRELSPLDRKERGNSELRGDGPLFLAHSCVGEQDDCHDNSPANNVGHEPNWP